MTIVAIAIGTAGALLGFFLGVRSKAVAKRKALDKERRQVQSLTTIVNRKAPPPPPPPRFIGSKVSAPNLKYKKPSAFSTYAGGTFAETSICNNCNTVGYYADMWTHKPCPECGGKVKHYGVCKWGKVDGEWQWIKSTAR